MPSRHVVLLNLSDAGRKSLDANLDALGEHVRAALDAARGALVFFQWTSGPYDAVVLVELDDDLVPGFCMWLGGTLGATTTTLRAFDDAELRAGLNRWDESQAQGSGLGP